MRIFADGLEKQVQSNLSPLYLIFGSEPFLIQESIKTLKVAFESSGVDEHYKFSIDAHFNWDDIFGLFQEIGLFSNQKLIELTLPESGTNATITANLIKLIPLFNEDTYLIISGKKLTKAQENTKWFKALEGTGVYVNCLTPDKRRLPQYIKARSHRHSLSLHPQSVQCLAEWYEGNLTALEQSLVKLALLYKSTTVSLEQVQEVLTQHAHYSVFNWIDSLLKGDNKRCLKILDQLEKDSIEPNILLRSLQKELLLISKIQREASTLPLNQVLSQYRVWQNKVPLYTNAVQRLSAGSLKRILRLLVQAEYESKASYLDTNNLDVMTSNISIWDVLRQMTISICHPEITSKITLEYL
ncbi:DNA polymerase III subunit delta [Vibrio sp.]|nr:DNA polymerase III subunit delta [Vibrio sp.]